MSNRALLEVIALDAEDAVAAQAGVRIVSNWSPTWRPTA